LRISGGCYGEEYSRQDVGEAEVPGDAPTQANPAKILIVVTEVTLALAVTEMTLEHMHKRHWHKVRNGTGF
jgi:hypothetical protein